MPDVRSPVILPKFILPVMPDILVMPDVRSPVKLPMLFEIKLSTDVRSLIAPVTVPEIA